MLLRLREVQPCSTYIHRCYFGDLDIMVNSNKALAVPNDSLVMFMDGDNFDPSIAYSVILSDIYECPGYVNIKLIKKDNFPAMNTRFVANEKLLEVGDGGLYSGELHGPSLRSTLDRNVTVNEKARF